MNLFRPIQSRAHSAGVSLVTYLLGGVLVAASATCFVVESEVWFPIYVKSVIPDACVTGQDVWFPPVLAAPDGKSVALNASCDEREQL
ncbi:MAG: hypothetical protein ACPGXK_01375 [Phycisphaerae bacterium]